MKALTVPSMLRRKIVLSWIRAYHRGHFGKHSTSLKHFIVMLINFFANDAVDGEPGSNLPIAPTA